MGNLLTIYLIRHARQNSGLCNVNVPLSKEGISQSELLGERLKEYNIHKVYSSDLIRAKMTADIVRNKLALEGSGDEESEELEELRETDFGDLTGLSDEVIKEKYSCFLEARDKYLEDVRIPGGENGQEVYNRMDNAMRKIIENGIKNNYSNIAVVSHGGAIRCYLAGLLNIPMTHRYMIAKNMENTSITEIRYNIDNGIFSLERLNDYSHIEEHKELLRKYFK